jgi:HTH-type transcriptional regulator / antitoxin HigA
VDIKPIWTDADHRTHLREIVVLWGATEGTKAGDRLEELVALTELNEERRWPILSIS